jgi:hypothetical protein
VWPVCRGRQRAKSKTPPPDEKPSNTSSKTRCSLVFLTSFFLFLCASFLSMLFVSAYLGALLVVRGWCLIYLTNSRVLFEYVSFRRKMGEGKYVHFYVLKNRFGLVVGSSSFSFTLHAQDQSVNISVSVIERELRKV